MSMLLHYADEFTVRGRLEKAFLKILIVSVVIDTIGIDRCKSELFIMLCGNMADNT